MMKNIKHIFKYKLILTFFLIPRNTFKIFYVLGITFIILKIKLKLNFNIIKI